MPLVNQPGLSLRVAGVLLDVRAALRRALRAARSGASTAAEPVKDAATAAIDAGKAVAETAERAAHAPKDVAREVRLELEAWTQGLARMAALGAAAALVGLFALALLTLFAVEGLDAVLGEPWGALVVGLAYALGAALLVHALLRAKAHAEAERALHKEHRQDDVAYVAEPVRDAIDAPSHPPAGARIKMTSE